MNITTAGAGAYIAFSNGVGTNIPPIIIVEFLWPLDIMLGMELLHLVLVLIH
jgi:hypothetical protein